MRLTFSKYEGLGNDFVIVEVGEPGLVLGTEQAIRICDRNLGIGADGVLLVSLAAGRASMKVINSDGSVPEMCGNGIRCVALHLTRISWLEGGPFVVDTDAGEHRCHVLEQSEVALVEVAMRPASLAPSEVPVLVEESMRDAPMEVGGEKVHVTAVSMGNPHAVIFDELTEEQRLRIGPLLQRDPRFPQSVNVGFAHMMAPERITLNVLERGAGWTRACGTGACAAAVAAVETGRAERHRPIEVHLPGGTLSIVVGDRKAPISMTGPARHVFDGVIEI